MNSRLAALSLAGALAACSEPLSYLQARLDCRESLARIINATKSAGNNMTGCDTSVGKYIVAEECFDALPVNCGTPKTRAVLAARIAAVKSRLVFVHCLNDMPETPEIAPATSALEGKPDGGMRGK